MGTMIELTMRARRAVTASLRAVAAWIAAPVRAELEPAPAAASTESSAGEPTPRARAGGCDDTTSTPARSNWTPEVRAPEEHAAALLAWLQGDGGRTGQLTFAEVAEMHAEMCLELGWAVASWPTVGRHFTPLSGGKHYRNLEGRKTRVFSISPLDPHLRDQTGDELAERGATRLAA